MNPVSRGGAGLHKELLAPAFWAPGVRVINCVEQVLLWALHRHAQRVSFLDFVILTSLWVQGTETQFTNSSLVSARSSFSLVCP
jgi:hypothetical protein